MTPDLTAAIPSRPWASCWEGRSSPSRRARGETGEPLLLPDADTLYTPRARHRHHPGGRHPGEPYAGSPWPTPTRLKIVGGGGTHPHPERRRARPRAPLPITPFVPGSMSSNAPASPTPSSSPTPDDHHHGPCMEALDMGRTSTWRRSPSPPPRSNLPVRSWLLTRRPVWIVAVATVLPTPPYYREAPELKLSGAMGQFVSDASTSSAPIRRPQAHSIVSSGVYWHEQPGPPPHHPAKSSHDLDRLRGWWILTPHRASRPSRTLPYPRSGNAPGGSTPPDAPMRRGGGKSAPTRRESLPPESHLAVRFVPDDPGCLGGRHPGAAPHHRLRPLRPPYGPNDRVRPLRGQHFHLRGRGHGQFQPWRPHPREGVAPVVSGDHGCTSRGNRTQMAVHDLPHRGGPSTNHVPGYEQYAVGSRGRRLSPLPAQRRPLRCPSVREIRMPRFSEAPAARVVCGEPLMSSPAAAEPALYGGR